MGQRVCQVCFLHDTISKQYHINPSYIIAYIRWLAKSSRPISLCEHDKAFRVFIKKITYGRYVPPCANTAYSELINLIAETESNMRSVINKYQHEGLMVSISCDIWSEDGK
jgi:hypothetical protein